MASFYRGSPHVVVQVHSNWLRKYTHIISAMICEVLWLSLQGPDGGLHHLCSQNKD